MTAEQVELEFRMLGPFEAVAQGRPVEPGGPRLRAVLARLAVVPGRTVGAGALAAELWGERQPVDAHRTVRTYTSRLRAALRRAGGSGAEELLVTRPPGYQLRADPGMIDAVRFERLAEAGLRALAAREPQLAVQRLTEALALWRGEALAEFGEHPALAAEAFRLERLRLTVVEARIEATLMQGGDAQAAAELEALVRAYPTRERLWGQLMTALYRSGRQAEALAAFRAARTVLIEVHGVEPSPELTEIHRRVLHHEVSLKQARRPSHPGPGPVPARGPGSGTVALAWGVD